MATARAALRLRLAAPAQCRGIKVYVKDSSRPALISRALRTMRSKQQLKRVNLRRREGRFFTKPTKARQYAAANKSFYKGVKEVEAAMAKVLRDNTDVGFGGG